MSAEGINKEAFVARIASANGVQLTVITFEIALAYIEQAISASDKDERREYAIKARASVENLIDSLDMSYELGGVFLSIYIYVNKLITDGFLHNKPGLLEEARGILDGLLAAWREADKTGANDPAIMENAQRIYAGLTYNNSGLAEYIPDDEKRGYTV